MFSWIGDDGPGPFVPDWKRKQDHDAMTRRIKEAVETLVVSFLFSCILFAAAFAATYSK